MNDHSRLSKKRICRFSSSLLYPSQKNVKTYEKTSMTIISQYHVMFFLFKPMCDIYVLFLVNLLTLSLTLLWQKPGPISGYTWCIRSNVKFLTTLEDLYQKQNKSPDSRPWVQSSTFQKMELIHIHEWLEFIVQHVTLRIVRDKTFVKRVRRRRIRSLCGWLYYTHHIQ